MDIGYDRTMGRITLLPPELVNHIAAGEVVERPSSVVKELVENAIDAGATRIEVQAKEGGRYLRVADNGCGMDRDDLEKAFQNHATSKVKSLDDLFNIQTLGFRGEALASVAAVAKVTCLSRTAQAAAGLKAIVAPTGSVQIQETGCAQGTILEVSELFYNVPARLKFLKRPQTELSHIQETIQMLALSHPEIAFQLLLEDAQAIKTSGSGDLSKAIHEVFSLSASETLLPLTWQDEVNGYRIRGQISTPDVSRGSKKWVMTYVNGRSVRCPILSKAIESAYSSMITPGRFPIAVLFVELPIEEVDVNVHPTKREVKYQQPNTLFSFVRRGVEQALLSATVQPGKTVAELPARQTNGHFNGSAGPRLTKSTGYPPASVPKTHAESAKPFSSVKSASDAAYSEAALELYAPAAGPNSSLEETTSSTSGPWLPQLPAYQVIGQLAKTYILVETAEGLLIVDQHIASERVRFEYFSAQAEKMEPVSQHLLIPLEFPVSSTLSAILEENQNILQTLGFLYQVTPQSVQFSQVPSLYSEKTLKTSLELLLHSLEETGEIKLSIDDVIATAACHSAVRAGDDLNRQQMERIIGQWFGCQRPWTCPHGRPVYHQITHRQLLAFFDRPSLPETASLIAPGKR